ncbi:hypothetical protein I5M27_09450 [Adhaeribacter sp. BT258]|uniref:GAF domain-containing protein n=1 Tax=Adhaeribacter terrigena TaxID=2793070 RepID=A0ABS1C1D8_9BACT|nr:hypothetical protein [Adhaeribacter terrigena]MBK0403210.1 hypothetical protein [Adhaeribacter terrigena]
MRYEFAQRENKDWSFEESKVIHDAFEFMANLPEGDPICTIGQYLSKVTGVKYLLIGRFVPPENDKVQTVCFLNGGQQLANMTYDLKNTPCYGVYQQQVCYYPFGVQEEFPEDFDLVVLGATSYMGAALKDYSGESIGLIVLMHDKTIENPALIDNLLSIVSPAIEKQLAG